MKKAPAVVVVTNNFTDGFMSDDLRILGQMVVVIPLETARGGSPSTMLPARLLRITINYLRLLYRFLRYDIRVVFFWFADNPYAPSFARLARVFGARVVVITGGVDSVYVPEIDWGALKSERQRQRFARVMERADSVLPFSDSATREINKDFAPKHIRTSYPAVDTSFFVPAAAGRERRVVTCAYAYHGGIIVQKGLDQFVAAARLVPDIKFVLVGDATDQRAHEFASSVPPNVEIVPRLRSRQAYQKFLASSSVYVQLSAHEGFGVSVAEAMASGSVPVVSDRYSLPEVVGEAGYVVEYGDAAAAAAAIRQALDAPEARRQAARQRVRDRFDQKRRVESLRAELVPAVPELESLVRLELGCGSTGVPGTIGVDLRRTSRTSAVCDVCQTCFKSGVADEVYSYCVLEHLDDPYRLMDEVVRVLKPDGRAFLRVPNLGTYSSHLDLTHRYLADLRIWRGMMEGYFESVRVEPVGTKYRDNPILTFINWVLVRAFRFNELAQGWTFVCERKRAYPTRYYVGWWQEQNQPTT